MYNNNLVEKQKYKSLHSLRQLKAIMEARETKAKSIRFRNNLIQSEKVANYQNELDRMRGALTQAELKMINRRSVQKPIGKTRINDKRNKKIK